ncbi:triose-phosphate isomerase [Candidatus Uhrbacteria bacterium]|nr:triose-phosphate isomerase [Candidatus Uhrbacteria bacterium]
MKKLIIANWKMHYGPLKAGAWVRAFRRERLPKDLDVAVAAPFVSLAAVRASLGRASIPALAAQDAFWANEGAFTGEIAPVMLSEFSCAYCLVGHSERRINLGETDEMVAKKAAVLQKAGISPVICVGETETQRRKGEQDKIVRAQLTAAVAGLKGDGRAVPVVAYEPVWAIGTGRPCTPQHAKDMHGNLRGVLKKKFGAAADHVRIVYGGSVDLRNIGEFLTTTGIDGALVGGASLDPRNFALLCRAAIPA